MKYKQIELLDSIMGSGKSTAIINWMIKNPQYKYLYVSPMLSEVEERIPQACASLEFVYPDTDDNHKTKSENLLTLLKEGCNVSFSHKLFTDMTIEHLQLIRENEYVLIIDEEIDMIEAYTGRYNKGDILSLENKGHIRVNTEDFGRVEWLWDDMEKHTAYSHMRNLCEMGMLFCTKRDREILVTQLPIDLIQAAQRTIILTYMFDGSVMDAFLRLRNIPVVPFTDVELMKSTSAVKQEAQQLINFFRTNKSKEIGKYNLSYSWYSKQASKDQLKEIGMALFSIFRKYDEKDILFTCPKSVVKSETNKPPARNILHPRVGVGSVDNTWLHCSARATNDYANKRVLIHLYNRFSNIPVKAYLQDYGCSLDDDKFALSELVQWVWRSAIRNGERIDLCIVSPRMDKLFRKWLSE